MHVTCAASYNIHIMPKSQHHNMHKLLCLCTRCEQTRENQIRGEIIQFYLCVVCVWFHLTEDICMSGLMQSTRHYFYRIGPLVYINVEGNTIAKMSWKILITDLLQSSFLKSYFWCLFHGIRFRSCNPNFHVMPSSWVHLFLDWIVGDERGEGIFTN